MRRFIYSELDTRNPFSFGFGTILARCFKLKQLSGRSIRVSPSAATFSWRCYPHRSFSARTIIRSEFSRALAIIILIPRCPAKRFALKNSDTGCSKRPKMRGARGIDEQRRICRYVDARRSSATKHVSLFQQPVESRHFVSYAAAHDASQYHSGGL